MTEQDKCPLCGSPLLGADGRTDGAPRAHVLCHRAVSTERERIKQIVEANVPHDGYCSMDDCAGCQLVDELKLAIDRDADD